MNKSLALKKKFYLFFSLVFSFLLFIYLIFFLINGPRGLISYIKLKNELKNNEMYLAELKEKNDFFIDRIERLNINTLDLYFLDEKIMKNT